MFKNKKTKSILLVCITLISILELYFMYKVNASYKGVYKIGIFIELILAQPFVFKILFIKENTISTYIALATILIPVIVYFTLHNYTYNAGKYIFKQSLKESKNFSFWLFK